MEVVTGAFSFTGKYIAARLLALGHDVATLTRHAQDESPFGDRVPAAALNFSDAAMLTTQLRGVETLYNTYWIRFPRREATFEKAVANTRALVDAARAADVRRIVHLSVTNPSLDSPFPYFRAKAAAEQIVSGSGLSYAVLRPSLVFGREDVLVRNIAWLLRRFPFFVVPGAGDYRVQPVAVEEVAELAVAAARRSSDEVFDAVGPEVLRFDEFVRVVRDAVGARAAILHASPRLALGLAGLVGRFVGDTVITRDELAALMENLLVSNDRPTARTRFSDWLTTNADALGRTYVSETRRNWS